jgi:uncharacterized protein DUF4296
MIFVKKNVGVNCSLMTGLFALLLLVAGCKQKFPSIPSDVIPLAKMENVLIDMHISDAVAETRSLGDGNEKKWSQQYYLQIYKNYGITKDEFLKSYLFYQNNPVLLNQMYDDILGEMSRREAQINK